MITEYLRYTVAGAEQEAFGRDYAAAAAALRRSPFAKSFELCQCLDDPADFILRIEWTSVEDHLDGFRNSPEFAEFFGHIRKYLGQMREMRHYRRIV